MHAFKFSKIISLETYCFDRAHFIVSTDPMRIMTIPSTLNGESGLVWTYIGDKKDLELQTVENIIANAQPMLQLYGYPEPYGMYVQNVHASAVKHMHKIGGGNIARVTAMTPPPNKDVYVCKKCGYVLPKKDATISGYDSQPSLRHVHCPKCGKIITHTL